jgi:ABC-2 type transport system permease protein
MNKTFLIFRHELVNTLKRTGFIIMTLAMPVIGLLAIGLTLLITNIVRPAAPEITSVGYVDQEGIFNQFTTQGTVQLVPYDSTDAAFESMGKGDIKEYLVIPADYSTTGKVTRFTLEKQPAAPPNIVAAVKHFLTTNLLDGKVPPPTINVIDAPLNLITVRLTASGEVAADQGGFGNLIIPGIFALLLVLSLTFSSAYLLQSLGDEKESRLIEVLLSSVTTRQLLTGKILGLGLAGFVQVIIWLIFLPLLLVIANSTFGGFFSSIQLPPNFIALGVLYFVLGYALFAVLSAISGAISPSAREGQQFASIFTLLAVSPFWFSSAIIAFPNSPVWIVLSIFPLTAPVVTMLRLGLIDVPAWQIAVSALVMIATTAGLLMVSIRILRTYLLVYGKRPSLGQIARIFRTG